MVAVREFFAARPKFSLVVHCCAVGGSRLQEDEPSVFLKNVKMLDNVLTNRCHYERIVYFSSGAATYSKVRL